MRRFHCDRCGAAVAFDAMSCARCDASLGYVADDLVVRTLVTSDDPAIFRLAGDPRPLWRCLNAAWGCNWLLPAGSGTPWCRSCRLTRGRPDDGRTVAMAAWMSAEAAKRRVIHQLDSLSLPIVARSPDVPTGLAFDLVHLPDEGAITGHRDGVVTLDLAETDVAHRGRLRRELDEEFRTVIGHLRHEMAHYFWPRLVSRSDELDEFRRVFGDERGDYVDAIEGYYRGDRAAWNPSRFVTAYAASHPLEDWAETFAHYLHITDVTDTALAYGFVPPVVADDVAVPPFSAAFADVLMTWRPINEALLAIAASLGAPPLYPFEPRDEVVDKLDFVHRRVGSIGHGLV